jgi:hypothetical protein
MFPLNFKKFSTLARVAHHIWLPYIVCIEIKRHMAIWAALILFLSHALIHKHSPIWLMVGGKALEIKEICINAIRYESKRPVGEIRQ